MYLNSPALAYRTESDHDSYMSSSAAALRSAISEEEGQELVCSFKVCPEDLEIDPSLIDDNWVYKAFMERAPVSNIVHDEVNTTLTPEKLKDEIRKLEETGLPEPRFRWFGSGLAFRPRKMRNIHIPLRPDDGEEEREPSGYSDKASLPYG